MTELHDLSALEQGQAVARGEVSPEELVGHYLGRADGVGAFATSTPDIARERARALGPRPDDAGPLWGVPTAIKDLAATAGVRTTFGSPLYADFVPSVSDEVVRRIEGAGLISLGKTSTPEFGSPCYTEPEGAPAAVTPWDRTRMAGGSSGGAGAAVAAGLVPLAHGSDGGGSIRIPASCCGVVGVKPSRGRVSGSPMYGDVVGLATAGPLARTVRDAAAYLDVMAGPAVGDPSWAPPPVGSFLGACDDPAWRGRRLRVARFAEPVIAAADVHPAVLAAWERTCVELVDLGHEVIDVAVPLPPDAVPVFEICWSVLTAMAVPIGAEGRVRPLTRWLTERGRAVSGPEFALAVGELRRVAAAALRALADFDLVVTPTVAQPPLPVGAIRNDADPAADFEAQKRFTPWTSAWNVTGMPAISLPVGSTADGLPVGVMLAARPAEDALLLAAATTLEDRLGPWPTAWA